MFESLFSMTAGAVVRAETDEKKTVAGACQKRTGSATLVTVHAKFACYERVFFTKKGKMINEIYHILKSEGNKIKKTKVR